MTGVPLAFSLDVDETNDINLDFTSSFDAGGTYLGKIEFIAIDKWRYSSLIIYARKTFKESILMDRIWKTETMVILFQSRCGKRYLKLRL
jgi:hypothetical protein